MRYRSALSSTDRLTLDARTTHSRFAHCTTRHEEHHPSKTPRSATSRCADRVLLNPFLLRRGRSVHLHSVLDQKRLLHSQECIQDTTNRQSTHMEPSSSIMWSGTRDSNPRHPAWEAGTLPTELVPQHSAKSISSSICAARFKRTHYVLLAWF